MFCCCAEETDEAATVIVPAVAYLEAPAARQAEVEPAAVEKAAAVDAPSVEGPVASTAVPAPPPKLEEPQAPQEFQAVLGRVGATSPYGWSLDMLNYDALYVESLAGDASTPVATYNKSASAGEDIRAGDYITRVNGTSGSARELSELLFTNMQTQVTIQRPSTYVVEVSRGDKPLGMSLNHTPKGKTLSIVNVRDGLLQEQAPEASKGHRILSVNGKNMSSRDLLDELKCSSLKLVILRAPVV